MLRVETTVSLLSDYVNFAEYVFALATAFRRICFENVNYRVRFKI